MEHVWSKVYSLTWPFLFYPPIAIVAWGLLVTGILLRIGSPVKFQLRELFILTPIVVPIFLAVYGGAVEPGERQSESWGWAAVTALLVQIIFSLCIISFIRGCRLAYILILLFLFCISVVTFIEVDSWVTNRGL